MEVLDNFDFKESKRYGKYNFEQYMDGKIYKLVKDLDFDVEPTSIYAQLKKYCQRKGYNLKINVGSDFVIFKRLI